MIFTFSILSALLLLGVLIYLSATLNECENQLRSLLKKLKQRSQVAKPQSKA